MRQNGTAPSAMTCLRMFYGTDGTLPACGAGSVPRSRLLVGLGLGHDFRRLDVDVARREFVGREEVVGQVRVVVVVVLEVRGLDVGDRHRDVLRQLLALE